jgi:hypothetical protein
MHIIKIMKMNNGLNIPIIPPFRIIEMPFIPGPNRDPKPGNALPSFEFDRVAYMKLIGRNGINPM